MTQADIPSRIVIPSAFAAKSTKVLPNGSMDSEGNVVNFADGFPSVYGCPSGGNGKFVTREEMNALGKIATLDHYIRACGGVFQFDPHFACAKGGYARGAILDCLEGMNYSRVISLVDNNLVDYTGGDPITENGHTTISGSVDGINWAYVTDVGNMHDLVLCEIGKIPFYTDQSKVVPIAANYPVGGFCAPRNGIPYFSGDITITVKPDSTTSRAGMCNMWLLEGGTSPSSLDGASPSTTTTGVTKSLIWTNIETSEQIPSLKSLTKGKYYSLWVELIDAGISDSTMKLRMS